MPFVPSINARKIQPDYGLRLFYSMERYWSGKAQVAPLFSYIRPQISNPHPLDITKVQSPEDLAWVQDPEGVMLGKYDF